MPRCIPYWVKGPKSVEYLSLPLLPGRFWLEVLIPIRISSMSEIDLFENIRIR